MSSSFSGSAIEALIKRADALAPDYSGKLISIPTDIDVCMAPPMMGKFFALKKKLEQEEQYTEDGELLKAIRADKSLCEHLAAHEFREAIKDHPDRKRMTVRMNGVIVILHRKERAKVEMEEAAE
ncbi:MAG: hypothetical protein JWL75_742 [Parcubacteria group bacterium]|nr:hypothetical protein [Parcubacteria group bacterium]